MSAGAWLPLRLRLLVVADCRDLFIQWQANDLNVCDEFTSWAEWVADLAEWQCRENCTAEHLSYTLGDERRPTGRLARRMAAVWFAEAARLAVEGL